MAIRVACVGDSITYGMRIPGRARRHYPAVLGRLLGPGFATGNFGVSGATVLKRGNKPYWALPQFRAATRWGPRVIVLALGTNDSKPENWRFRSEFAGDLAAMIGHFRAARPKPRVWVCLPPPVFVPAGAGISDPVMTRGIAPLIRRVARKLQAPLIDLHRPLRRHPELLPDGVHPSAAGAKVIAQTVYAALSRKPTPR
jgi:acyl-CoA thioesterase I